ncbi:hypothetical protein BSKO_05019 [Bryopsis sp. KO-2023]|nr:hypothetical protein BSKO_05019 [Bryopsis sp. KO-2023]
MQSAGRSTSVSQAPGQSQTPQAFQGASLPLSAPQGSQRTGQPAAQSAQKAPSPVLTTETIQKLLEENHSLIRAILESNSQGKTQECQRYHQRLQQNLMYLAAVADSQPQPPVQQSHVPIRPQQSGASTVPPPAATPVASTPSATTPSMTPQMTPQLSPATTPTTAHQSPSTTPSPSPPPTPHAIRPAVHTLSQQARSSISSMGCVSNQGPQGSAAQPPVSIGASSLLQGGVQNLPQASINVEDVQPTRKQKIGEGPGDVVAKWGGT